MKTKPTSPKLTEKQRQFVANKVAGCTNRDAAVAAGYAVGSASAAADKLMAMPAIRAAINAGAPSVDAKTSAPAMPRGKYDDPKSFLLDVMNLDGLPIAVRADAAFKLMPYMHARMGETGKKESAKDKAREIARGRSKFATKAPPPRLTVVRSD